VHASHAMFFFSHLSYCITAWSQTSASTLKPVISLYEQAIKIFDKKPMISHHCDIIQKHKIFTFENFVNFSILKLTFKCLNNCVSPLFSGLIERHQGSLRPSTRASVSGDCVIPKFRKSFGLASPSERLHYGILSQLDSNCRTILTYLL